MPTVKKKMAFCYPYLCTRVRATLNWYSRACESARLESERLTRPRNCCGTHQGAVRYVGCYSRPGVDAWAGWLKRTQGRSFDQRRLLG